MKGALQLKIQKEVKIVKKKWKPFEVERLCLKKLDAYIPKFFRNLKFFIFKRRENCLENGRKTLK